MVIDFESLFCLIANTSAVLALTSREKIDGIIIGSAAKCVKLGHNDTSFSIRCFLEVSIT